MTPSRSTESFRRLTLETFVDKLASAEPVPGGGAASAIAAALGAGLVAMVAGLSEGRERYAVHASLHAEAKALGGRLAQRFLALADEDADAYAQFAAALKLPRATDDEKLARTAAVRAAARVAAEVPLLCVECCVELAQGAEALAGRSNRNASSDLTVASLLAEAAARGAAANVTVNLPAVGDEAYAAEMDVRVADLVAQVETLGRRTREVVQSQAEREPMSAGPG